MINQNWKKAGIMVSNSHYNAKRQNSGSPWCYTLRGLLPLNTELSYVVQVRAEGPKAPSPGTVLLKLTPNR